MCSSPSQEWEKSRQSATVLRRGGESSNWNAGHEAGSVAMTRAGLFLRMALGKRRRCKRMRAEISKNRKLAAGAKP
jgi:hypothetical protein